MDIVREVLQRKRPLEEKSPELCSLLKQTQFDVVVDFSGYDAFAVREAVTLVEGHVGLYIYISSDSVYEVCDVQPRANGIRETDAVPHPEHRRACKYGRKKLEGEDELRKSSRVSYLILRLADVIGPRDCTDRFWEYYLWMKMAEKLSIPVKIPQEYVGKDISFTYTEDVAGLIADVVGLCVRDRSTIINEEYNIACKGTLTLTSLLQEIHKHSSQTSSSEGCLNIDANTSSCPNIAASTPSSPNIVASTSSCPNIVSSSSSSVPCIYPSVEKGGLLDTRKSRK
jgi:dTDP-4-dehydrorhamnose reductase